ncbi:MAG: tRNA (adenosine(37)-N6)-threonylcarbamoyltransferase complex transferase subunit TsaD [bacterium]
MYFLAIESSCDETSLALLEGNDRPKEFNSFIDYIDNFKVISSVISSQISTHVIYGGVVPEVGAREHAQNINLLFDKLFAQITDPKGSLQATKDIYLSSLNAIFVTNEPGLISALRVGMEFAKSLSFFIGQKYQTLPEVKFVNHLRGHLFSSFYHQHLFENQNSAVFPHLHLLVSGGNTQLFLLDENLEQKLIGQTLDDAAGECLDKVGRMLGLPYPGGVWLSKIAKKSQENACNFPVSMAQNGNFDFSYSGLKTAVRYFLQAQNISNWKIEQKLEATEIELLIEGDLTKLNLKLKLIYKVAVSAQTVVVQQLTNKVKNGIKKFSPKSIGLSGGVSANLLLRSKLEALDVVNVLLPEKQLTGDNAVMIALAGLSTNS